MRDFWNRFCNDRNWFLATIVVVFFLGMFFWHLIGPESYTRIINNFLEGIWTAFKFFLTLVLIVVGVMLMFGWRPFKKKKTNNNSSH